MLYKNLIIYIMLAKKKVDFDLSSNIYIEPFHIDDSTNILIFTSLVFITNIMTALYREHYLYAFFFFCLTVTSLIVHNYNNEYTNLIDKVSIFFIVTYGAYMLYCKSCRDNYVTVSIIVITFLLCVFLYVYGYMKNNYCFNHDKEIANLYHALLHFIGSLGHHLIIFL